MAKPESISGFPEYTPGEQIAFNGLMDIIRRHYQRAGAVPLETPAVERTETLLAKGGNDKEIYGLRRLNAKDGAEDGKDLALHFDLTVPLARYVAQYNRSLTFPFRRYQMQPVWRGEKAQAGRYRQFYQCDFDVIGNQSLSLLHDAEMPALIAGIFREMGLPDFRIHINNRKILQGLFSHFGLDDDQVHQAIAIVDDLEKTGRESFCNRLQSLGLQDDSMEQLTGLFLYQGNNNDILKRLHKQPGNDDYRQGVAELAQVMIAVNHLGLDESTCVIDPTIARGLDYYTGTIYETRLTDYPELGSICSGGRYDNLTGLFTRSQYPGVGISIGLTRLFSKLMAINAVNTDIATVAPVMIANLDPEACAPILQLGSMLRRAGINTEIYLENKKLNAQMKYADKKGFTLVLMIGEEELATNTVRIKDMRTGAQLTVPVIDLVKEIQSLL